MAPRKIRFRRRAPHSGPGASGRAETVPASFLRFHQAQPRFLPALPENARSSAHRAADFAGRFMPGFFRGTRRAGVFRLARRLLKSCCTSPRFCSRAIDDGHFRDCFPAAGVGAGQGAGWPARAGIRRRAAIVERLAAFGAIPAKTAGQDSADRRRAAAKIGGGAGVAGLAARANTKGGECGVRHRRRPARHAGHRVPAGCRATKESGCAGCSGSTSGGRCRTPMPAGRCRQPAPASRQRSRSVRCRRSAAWHRGHAIG